MTDSLAHLYWIGGSPCAGKSSISQWLAEHWGLEIYAVDSAFDRHIQHLDAHRHPALTRWCNATWDERWMQPADQLLREVIACYSEHFSLVLEDLYALTEQRPLLVEGSALLPRLVAEVAPDPQRMIWIVPTADFQRTYYAQRPWIREILAECRQPEAAFANWMERDARFACWVITEAAGIGGTVLQVDGQQSLPDNARAVVNHFGLATRVET